MAQTSPPTIKIGTQLSQGRATWAQNRDAWIAADTLGLDTIFNCDHFFPDNGTDDGLFLEAWMIVAAMAEVTSNAQIGVLVTGNSYRNPNLLADMARTCDHISGGRVILGIGSGWAGRDYDAYGYEFGTPASRLADLKRDLPIIRNRFAQLNPGPVHGKIPIMIGGSGEKVTLRLVAEYADIWHGQGTFDTLQHKASVLDSWCNKVGRDPAGIERSANIKPDDIGQADAYAKAGFTHLIVGSSGPEFKLDGIEELIAWRDARNASVGTG